MSYEPAIALEQAIMQGGLPAWVVSAKPQFIEDADGEAALSVIIVISPEKADIFTDAQQLLNIKHLVRKALRQSGVHVFPYFKFVSATDL